MSGDNSGNPILPDSKVLFEKLFESLPDAVLVADREGIILLANQRAETMFGHARRDLIGQPVEALLPERFRSEQPPKKPRIPCILNLESAEREHILRVLRDCHGMIGGKGGAAERLGLKRTTLNSMIKKLGIQRRDYI